MVPRWGTAYILVTTLVRIAATETQDSLLLGCGGTPNQQCHKGVALMTVIQSLPDKGASRKWWSCVSHASVCPFYNSGVSHPEMCLWARIYGKSIASCKRSLTHSSMMDSGRAWIQSSYRLAGAMERQSPLTLHGHGLRRHPFVDRCGKFLLLQGIGYDLVQFLEVQAEFEASFSSGSISGFLNDDFFFPVDFLLSTFFLG